MFIAIIFVVFIINLIRFVKHIKKNGKYSLEFIAKCRDVNLKNARFSATFR